jgi:uncharacterized protein YgiM (DUF1202 family)
MTEAQLRSKVANWPVQYLGISEKSAGHVAIINTFNNSKLCTRYKMTTKDAWCATTASASFIANGLAGAPGSGKLFQCVECSCGEMIKLAQKQGIWVEKDNYTPKVGDLIMYDWNDNGVGDNTGWPDHVGIVHTVSGSSFKVIEGNRSDTVKYVTMAVNAKTIRGFITPNYAAFATVNESKPTPGVTPKTLNKTCKFKGKVTAKKELNVREWAGTSSKTLRKLKKGVVVEVCDTIQDKSGDDWYYIKESGKYGFVSADYIAKVTDAPTSTNTGLNKTCKFKGKVVAKSGVNVRDWAGAENKKLRTIAKGKTVEVCDSVKAKSGKMWYYIKESGKYGFVCAEYIARI